MGHFLYKGLKKPLVFFGLKDKYIYYAMGSAVGGLVTVAVLSSLIGLFGTIAGAALGVAGVWLSFRMQDKRGLYNKTKNDSELHMMPKRFDNSKLLKNKNKR